MTAAIATYAAWCLTCDGPSNVDALGCIRCRETKCSDCGVQKRVLVTMLAGTPKEHRVCVPCWSSK